MQSNENLIEKSKCSQCGEPVQLTLFTFQGHSFCDETCRENYETHMIREADEFFANHYEEFQAEYEGWEADLMMEEHLS